MRLWSAAKSRMRVWLQPARAEQDMATELQFHVEKYAEDLVCAGVPRDEALRRAYIAFGGVEKLKEECRETNGKQWLQESAQDLRYGWRMLRKNPGFTAVVVLTLALGIGANTAIFSVVYAVLLKPLPYAQSNQLYNVFQERVEDSNAKTGWSFSNFEDLQKTNTIFTSMAGAQFHQLTMTGRGDPSVLNTSVVTSDFFSVFGERPLAGRLFLPEDGRPGSSPVVILSENLWRGTFAADPQIFGSSITSMPCICHNSCDDTSAVVVTRSRSPHHWCCSGLPSGMNRLVKNRQNAGLSRPQPMRTKLTSVSASNRSASDCARALPPRP